MPGEKTFTQDDMNGAVRRARMDWEAEQARLSKDIADRDTIIAAAKARISELEPLAAALETERGTHRKYRRDGLLKSAFEESKVLPKALRQAMRFFDEEFELLENEVGAVTGAARRADGQLFDTLQKATEAFLAANDHMLSAGRPVGGGTRSAGNSVGLSPIERHPPAAPTPVEMIDRGLKADKH